MVAQLTSQMLHNAFPYLPTTVTGPKALSHHWTTTSHGTVVYTVPQPRDLALALSDGSKPPIQCGRVGQKRTARSEGEKDVGAQKGGETGDGQRTRRAVHKLTAWRERDRIVVLHLTGKTLESVALTNIATRADKEVRFGFSIFSPECVVQIVVETAAVVDLEGESLSLLRVSGVQLGSLCDCDRLIAAQSDHSVWLLRLYDRRLEKIACVGPAASLITGAAFCPYSYPELAIGCADGSVYAVDLGQLQTDRDVQLRQRQILMPVENRKKRGSAYACVCIYGKGPWQYLAAYGNTIRVVDGWKDVPEVVEINYEDKQTVLAIEKAQNFESPSADTSALFVVMTQNRVVVHSLHTLPDRLFLWEIPQNTLELDRLQFTLKRGRISDFTDAFAAENAEKEIDVGTVFCGSAEEGTLMQFAFLCGSPQMSVRGGERDSATLSFVPRGEIEGEVPLQLTRLCRYVAEPSLLCHPLSRHDTTVWRKGVDVLRYIARRDRPIGQTRRRLPAREAQLCIDLLQQCPDCADFAIVQPKADEEDSGLLIRMAVTGDLVIHRLAPRKEGIRADRSTAARWQSVLGEGGGEMGLDSTRRFGSWIDLAEYSLNVSDAKGDGDESLLEVLNDALPEYLKSAALVEATSAERSWSSEFSGLKNSIPLAFHRAYFVQSEDRERQSESTVKRKRDLSEAEILAPMEVTSAATTVRELVDSRGGCRLNPPVYDMGDEDAGKEDLSALLVSTTKVSMSEKDRIAMAETIVRTRCEDSEAEIAEVVKSAVARVEGTNSSQVHWHRTYRPEPLFGVAKEDVRESAEFAGEDVVLMPARIDRTGARVPSVQFASATFEPRAELPASEAETDALELFQSLWKDG